MSVMLRVERESTGELGGIPLVWQQPRPRPNTGRGIHSLAKVAPTNLVLIKGSRSKTPLSNGRIQDTFNVLGKRGNKNTQTDVSRLEQFFELAGIYAKDENYTDFIYLVDQVKDEISPRKSVIYSGKIFPVDDQVVSQDMESDYAIFTVTMERDRVGEFGEVIGSQPLGEVLSSHGGTIVLPSQFASNGTVSRASNIMIRDARSSALREPGYIKKVWLGIKPNRTGFIYLNPSINFGLPTYTITVSEDAYYNIDLYETSIGYHNIAITFSSETNWAIRTRSPMKRWNDDIIGMSNSTYYHYAGKYHVVGRYKIEGGADTVIGHCIGTGWKNHNTINWNTKKFLRPAIDSKGNEHWQYENFGTINIGGGMWGTEIKDRLILGDFSIFTQSQLAQGDSSTILYLDNIHLVPADHYLYLELDTRMGPENRIELFQNMAGEISGYVAASSLKDLPGKPLQGLRNVSSGISNLTHENWGIPFEEKSLLVAVAGEDKYHSKNRTSQLRIDMAIKRRTAGYTYDD